MFEQLKGGEAQIVGVYSYEKNGRSGSSVSFVQNFQPWQAERGLRADGLHAETEFTRMDCSGLQVGDVVRLAYGKGFQGKAELIGYSVVKRISPAKG